MNKRKFRFISDLISSQKEMFSGKSKALEELYDLCDNEEKESLVKQLLVDFTEMNDDIYSLCLEDMSRYIVNSVTSYPSIAIWLHKSTTKRSAPPGVRAGITTSIFIIIQLRF